MSTTEDAAPKVASAAAWKKQAIHAITLNSGAVVEIKVPDLPALIEAGEIPQNLLEVAVGAAKGDLDPSSTETFSKEREFTDRLVRLTVVNPKLSEEDVRDVPFEDKDLIMQIATRQRDFDAVGDHIGGLHTSEKFRKFRRLDGIDSNVEDV